MQTAQVVGLVTAGALGIGAVAYLASRDDRKGEISDLAQTKFSTADKPAAIADAVASPRSVSDVATIFDAVETTVSNQDKLEVLHDALYSQWTASSVDNFLRNDLQYRTDSTKVPTADAVLNGPNPGY